MCKCDDLPFNLAFLYCRLRQQKKMRSARKTAATRAAKIPLRDEIESSSKKDTPLLYALLSPTVSPKFHCL